MSFLVDAPKRAFHLRGRILVVMESGLEVSFPIAENPRLAGRSHEELDEIELSPLGLHWPKLDEDLSMRGILAGDYGQRFRRTA